MKSILPGAPWLLAHSSMLEVNKPKKVSLYGCEYVLWKDQNHKISALPNTCPHLGAMLSEGWCEVHGDSSNIVCPFHALEFDSEGCTILPGSTRKTKPQIQPLELIIEGDFIWSYGGHEPQVPIPSILNEIAGNYQFIGYTAETSVKTDLLTMLLNMHDYNHQNGTHRELFKITEVKFGKFIDNGHQSHAFFETVTAPYSILEKLKKPSLLVLPDVIKAHLENHFPSLVIFHGESTFGKIAQCHLFIPESETQTRTYVLMYGIPKNPLFKVLGKQFLEIAQVIVEQDTDILNKLYANQPQKIKLNNEVGMDWVRRNFKSFPKVVEPSLSK